MDERVLERIAEPGYLGDLPSRPIEEIRTMRAECQGVEDGVSFLRRQVQGRLDIVRAEGEHRATGSGRSDLADLVANLPATLASHVGGGSVSLRPPTSLASVDDVTLLDEVDAVCSAKDLTGLPKLDDDGVARLERGLVALERVVSDRRRLLFDRLDAISGELTRRYRQGEATVDSLLS